MKYRANANEVEAQKIKEYRYDSGTAEYYVVLEDGTRKPRPTLHGVKPEVGDWYVESLVLTSLRNGELREESAQIGIVKASDFARIYYPVESAAELTPEMLKLGEELAKRVEETDTLILASVTGRSLAEIAEVKEELKRASGEAVQTEDPYPVFVMPDMVEQTKEIINADDAVNQEPETIKEQLTEWAKDVIAKDTAAPPKLTTEDWEGR